VISYPYSHIATKLQIKNLQTHWKYNCICEEHWSSVFNYTHANLHN